MPGLALLAALLELARANCEGLTMRRSEKWIMKRSTHPLAGQSAGCIFRNPRGLSAGALIEQCGLKGLSVGKARVSERHANFIVTEDGATSKNVELLISRIQKAVAEKFSVSLNDLLGKRRTQNIATARHVCMYLCRKLTAHSYPEIGAFFGGRDHSTAIHAHKIIVEKCADDPNFSNELSSLEKKITG